MRSGHGLRDLSARLNGRPIAHEFGPRRRGGVRLAVVGASHGLRHGINVLKVVARQPGAKRRKGATVRFFVAHGKPLAGAGLNRRIHLRQRIALDGSASRGVPRAGVRRMLDSGPRPRRRPNLSYRWVLLRAPKGSSLRHPNRRRAGTATASRARGGHTATARFAGTTSRRASFKPDAPGSYVFRLTVGDGLRFSSDRVRIDAAPRGWLVPVDAMATSGGEPGIAVGGEFYPAGQGGGACLVQVVVLERATLGRVANRTFGERGCAGDPEAGGDAATRTARFLAKYDDSKLVVASSQPGFSAPGSYGGALGGIGLRTSTSAYGSPHDTIVEGRLRVDPGRGGMISVIGVPGMAAGEAQVRVVYDGEGEAPGAGGLDGYLTPDQFENFKWMPRERIEFDLRAAGGVPKGRANTIEIGDQQYPATLPDGASGGYQVLALDRRTLRPRAPQRTFAVSAGQSVQASHDALQAMHDYIRANVRELDLLFVVSLGAPVAHVESWDVAPALSDLAGLIGYDGGSRNTFVWTLRHQIPYALVGSGAAGQLGGEEAHADDSGRGTRLRGALMTDELSVFGPRDASGLADSNDGLIQELLKRPTAKWPLDGEAEAKAALSYIGSQIPQLGPDPRSAYVNSPNWDAVKSRVREVAYPGPDRRRAFCPEVALSERCPALERAKAQLIHEIGQVENVREYLDNLAKPFSEDALVGWASLQSLTEKIQKAAEAKPNEQVLSLVLDIFGGVLDVIPLAFPETLVIQSVIAEVVAVTYSTAIEYWSQNREGGDDDEVRTTASRLGLEMAERFKDAQATFRNMGNVIVTDPAKLERVGDIANCNPGGSACPDEWAWTDAVRSRASSALLRGTEAGFYQELLPLAFPTYRLVPPPNEITRGERPTIEWPAPSGIDKFYCGDFGRNFPFKGRHPLATINLHDATFTPISPSYSTEAFRPYLAYAIGAKANVDATHPSPAPPPQEVLDRMFSPVDPSGRAALGGLGIDQANYMMQTKVEYGPKDPFGSSCGWLP